MNERLYINVDDRKLSALTARMDFMMLPTGKRFKILREMGRQIRNRARDNIRLQKTVDGSRMPPRKKGKGKVLRKLGRNLTTQTSKDNVTVKYKNTRESRIAYKQQHGVTEKWTAEKMARRFARQDYKSNASRQQAVSLLQAGYRLYAGKNKGGSTKSRKPSVSWITKNLTSGYAGYMIRQLRQSRTIKRWSVSLPARAFLGVTEDEGVAIFKKIMREQLKHK